MSAASTSVSQVDSVLIGTSTPATNVSQTETTLVGQTTPAVNVSQVDVCVVYSINPGDPKIRAWTYTLDGHDFYVLSLGQDSTVVYDTYSSEWSVFGSEDTDLWRAQTGQNWLGAGSLPNTYGSNVIAGDYSLGTLYLLDPSSPSDDAPTAGGVKTRFQRVAYGQIPLRSPDYVPCFGMALYGSQGDFNQAADSFDVSLSTSDDAGHTFSDQGAVTVLSANYNQRVEWRSLGSMSSPGRLFKVTDDGAFVRIDGMELLEDGQ